MVLLEREARSDRMVVESTAGSQSVLRWLSDGYHARDELERVISERLKRGVLCAILGHVGDVVRAVVSEDR